VTKPVTPGRSGRCHGDLAGRAGVTVAIRPPWSRAPRPEGDAGLGKQVGNRHEGRADDAEGMLDPCICALSRRLLRSSFSWSSSFAGASKESLRRKLSSQARAIAILRIGPRPASRWENRPVPGRETKRRRSVYARTNGSQRLIDGGGFFLPPYPPVRLAATGWPFFSGAKFVWPIAQGAAAARHGRLKRPIIFIFSYIPICYVKQ